MRNSEALHHHEAERIGEREGLITLLLADNCRVAAVDLEQHAKRSMRAKAGKQQGVSFGEDEVGGKQMPALGNQPLLDLLCGLMGVLATVG
jgi:hypothetical protein